LRLADECAFRLLEAEAIVSAGMSNPIPTEPPEGEKIAVLTPITLRAAPLNRRPQRAGQPLILACSV
jgi:hypothetical protein